MKYRQNLFSVVFILLVTLLFGLQSAKANPSFPQPLAGELTTTSANCPHVRILTRANADEVEEQFRSAVVSPGANQKETLRLALDALPPLVCKSVRRVVFLNATLPSAGEAIAWVGRSRPDLINVSAVPGGASEQRLDVDLSDIPSMDDEQNERRKRTLVRVWPEVIHSIIHEAYHCAVSLLETATDDSSGPTDVWPAGAKSAAKTAIAKTKLTGGFVEEWERLNEEFEDLSLGTDYDDSRTGRATQPPTGFMTNYGGNKAGEDIAETASWVTAKGLLDANYGGVTADLSHWKYACTQLAATNKKGIPGNLAALYTKIRLLEDLELVTEADIKKCIGSGTVGLETPAGGKGIQFFDFNTWRPYTAFGTDVKLVRNSEMFAIGAWGQLRADGKLHRSSMEIRFMVDEDEYPRGVYEIKSCNLFLKLGTYPFASPVVVKRSVEGMGNQTICAYQALVLVTTASTERFRGSVILHKVWKFSFPPVPEVKGFPVHVVFRYG